MNYYQYLNDTEQTLCLCQRCAQEAENVAKITVIEDMDVPAGRRCDGCGCYQDEEKNYVRDFLNKT